MVTFCRGRKSLPLQVVVDMGILGILGMVTNSEFFITALKLKENGKMCTYISIKLNMLDYDWNVI